MDDAKAEVLAFSAVPRSHWTKIWSTNPRARLNE
jgi:putative transposase